LVVGSAPLLWGDWSRRLRVWEEQARDAEEPLEWVRLPSVLPTTLEGAWERVEW